jgi:Zn-dependent metalloprotease
MRKGIVACIAVVMIQVLAAFGALAASRIYLPEAGFVREQLATREAVPAAELGSVLGFSSREGLRLLAENTDENDVTHTRYVQLFDGIPVWGYHIIAATDEDDSLVSLHGTRVADIEADIDPERLAARPLKTEREMLAAMKRRHAAKSLAAGGRLIFENEVSEKVIYVGEDGRARLCFHVSFFADAAEGGSPSRPVILVDAVTEEIVLEFEGLTHAEGTGPGGNVKIGKYRYGTDYPPFEVTQSGGNCVMNNANVKTVNLNHGTSGSTAYQYACYENTFKEINGGYSPLNDAHAFGAVVFDMYAQWFNTAPLTFQLMMRVHYSTGYDNAFWNGSSMTFGDGKTYFYPLVSLDVVAHEVSHGFTEQNSKLIYSNQSGGINEAFSDMAGEAAEFFHRSQNDFMVGYDIWKLSATGALRYMDNPPKDGKSIGSAKDYKAGMDVHYSSGVFNKAFWALATTPGWDTKKAFAVFVKANQNYWQPSTNFQQGAEGARDAAIALGFSAQAVKNAFAKVDITIDAPPDIPPLVEILSVSTGRKYALGLAQVGSKPYIDRTYTIKKIGAALAGGALVQTANDDKKVAAASHLKLKALKDIVLYAAYDKRGQAKPPTWLAAWQPTIETLETTDADASPMKVFKKSFAAGAEITLGGNLQGGDNGARSNYFLVARPLETTLVDILSVSTGKAYALTAAKPGAKAYIDRDYTVTALSAGLAGGVLVQTANDDKKVAAASHLALKANRAATIYVAYDRRATKLPAWLAAGWTATAESLGTTDSGASPLKVYQKTVAAGAQITLGGNMAAGAAGAESHYLVVVK